MEVELMGAIVRRGTKDRPRFYLQYVDVDGQRRMKAAKGATTKAQAKVMLAEIERRVMSGKLGIPEPDPAEVARAAMTVREIGEKFTTEYAAPRLKNPTEYRAEAKSTLEVRVYPHLGDRPAASVRPIDVEKLRDTLLVKYKPASVVLTLAALSKLYTWAAKQGHIDCSNPAKGIERPRLTPSIEYLSRKDTIVLLDEARETSTVDVYAMVAMAIYTGMRKGELAGLRWSDVHLDAGRIDVARSYALAPKSGKARHLPIHAELAPILRAWSDEAPANDGDLVFPVDGGMGETWDMFGLPDLLKRAGIAAPSKPWHALRHTFASHFMMSGGNILTLQKLLGHSSVTMTMVYAHLAPDFMAAEVARMSFAASRDGVTDINKARADRHTKRTREANDGSEAADAG